MIRSAFFLKDRMAAGHQIDWRERQASEGDAEV